MDQKEIINIKIMYLEYLNKIIEQKIIYYELANKVKAILEMEKLLLIEQKKHK